MAVEHDDDLFAPALAGRRRGVIPKGERPWRPYSQFYVGFFGGALAAATIAWFNAKRLGIEGRTRWLIPVVGVAGLAATIAAVLVVLDGDFESSQRILARLVGVATAGVLVALQTSADRVYHSYAEGGEDELYDSMWVPGLAATIGMGIVQAAILGVVLQAV